jgi:hypothetical protein
MIFEMIDTMIVFNPATIRIITGIINKSGNPKKQK